MARTKGTPNGYKKCPKCNLHIIPRDHKLCEDCEKAAFFKAQLAVDARLARDKAAEAKAVVHKPPRDLASSIRRRYWLKPLRIRGRCGGR